MKEAPNKFRLNEVFDGAPPNAARSRKSTVLSSFHFRKSVFENPCSGCHERRLALLKQEIFHHSSLSDLVVGAGFGSLLARLSV